MARTAIARNFSVLFKKALTDKIGKHEKTTKEKETDYYSLTFFIHGLTRRDDISACLDEYLKIYTDYPRTDRRSTFIFTILLKTKIEKSKEDDKYIDEISDMLAETKPPFTSKLRERYEDLESGQKIEIQAELTSKKTLQKQGAGILSVLRKAFYKENKKEPTLQELSNFHPAPDKVLEQKFNAVKSRCRDLWSKSDIQNIEDSINEFVAFLASQKDCLNLFQVLKWCRDVVEEHPIRIVRDQYGNVQTHKPGAHDEMDSELYFQCAYRVFKYAIDHGYSKNYAGFTKDEMGFFFNPLSSEYWYENYLNRYYSGTTKGALFKEATTLFLRLLLFARLNDAQLVNNREAADIRTIYKNTSKSQLRKRSFYLGVGRESLRKNVRIGDRFGKVVVVYFDKVDTRSGKPLYVEFVGIKNLLFRISVNTLSDFNDLSFYTTLWANTAHLLKLIPLIFQLLGYTFSFITGGFSALAFDILTDVVVEEYAEAAKLSSGATTALSVATKTGIPIGMAKVRGIGTPKVDVSGALDKALNKQLANLAGDEAKALKSVENIVGADAKALGKTQSSTSTTHANERLATSDNTIRNRGTGRANQGTGDTGGGGSGRGGPGGGGGGGGGTIPPRRPRPDPPNYPYNVAISMEYAGEIVEQLINQSVWLRELQRIYRLPPARHAAEMLNFRRVYWEETGIRIDIRPANHPEVNFYRLGPAWADNGLNWGTYLPRERRIVMHEGIFNRQEYPGVSPVREIGHEVGAAELGRVLGIPKDNIPAVYDLPSPLSSLTHVIDMRLRPSD